MGIKSHPGIDTVAPELLPVLVVGDLTRPESAGGKTRLGIGTATQAGAASNYAQVQLWNPDNSGVDVVLQKAWVALGGAGIFQLQVFDTALTTLSAKRRYADQPFFTKATAPTLYLPNAQVRNQNHTAIYGTQIGEWRVSTVDSFLVEGLLVRLPPGRGLHFAAQAANINLYCDYWWEEQPRDVQ